MCRRVINKEQLWHVSSTFNSVDKSSADNQRFGVTVTATVWDRSGSYFCGRRWWKPRRIAKVQAFTTWRTQSSHFCPLGYKCCTLKQSVWSLLYNVIKHAFVTGQRGPDAHVSVVTSSCKPAPFNTSRLSFNSYNTLYSHDVIWRCDLMPFFKWRSLLSNRPCGGGRPPSSCDVFAAAGTAWLLLCACGGPALHGCHIDIDTSNAVTVIITGPQTVGGKTHVGLINLLYIIMFKIWKIKAKFILGLVKAQKFSRWLQMGWLLKQCLHLAQYRIHSISDACRCRKSISIIEMVILIYIRFSASYF